VPHPVPTTIPTTVDALLDPEWLTAALDDVGDDERVVDVSTEESLATVASKLRFAVTVEAADGTRRVQQYCAKGQFDGTKSSLGWSETHFYRDLAPHVTTRVPRVYYAGIDDETGHSVVIMDDVVAIGGRFMSAHDPYPIATARDTLGQLARLHAATWRDEPLMASDWLAPRMMRMAETYADDYLQSLLDDGRGPDIAPELRDARNVKAALLRTAQFAPTCVIHGDTHSGNVYLDKKGRACWLDWQIVQRGTWATDVSYHLGTTLAIDDRRAHEAELLRHYLGELASQGAAAPAFDDAWEQYTLGFSYGYFLWVITRISSRAVVLIHIPRLAAALADHDTYRRLGVV
jgi:aminoglycoside phosphotransferase (APT) family kinase protein